VEAGPEGRPAGPVLCVHGAEARPPRWPRSAGWASGARSFVDRGRGSVPATARRCRRGVGCCAWRGTWPQCPRLRRRRVRVSRAVPPAAARCRAHAVTRPAGLPAWRRPRARPRAQRASPCRRAPRWRRRGRGSRPGSNGGNPYPPPPATAGSSTSATTDAPTSTTPPPRTAPRSSCWPNTGGTNQEWQFVALKPVMRDRAGAAPHRPCRRVDLAKVLRAVSYRPLTRCRR